MVSSSNPGDRVDRRSVLKTAGAGGVILLSGCLGDDDDPPEIEDDGVGGDSDSVADDSDDGFHDATFTINASHLTFDNPQYNTFNPTNSGFHFASPGRQLFVHTSQFDREANMYHPVLFEDWSIEGTTAEIDISDEFRWHDDEPITAEEVALWLKLDAWRVDEHPWLAGPEGIEAVDDHTVRAEARREWAIGYVERQIFDPDFSIRDEVFRPFLEQFQDATEGSIDEVRSELIDFSWEVDEIIGNGPFMLDEASDTEFILRRNEDYPWHDNLNFNYIRYRNQADDHQALIEGDADAIFRGFPADDAVMQQMPDDLKTDIRDNPRFATFWFNPTNEPTSNRKFRQAIAHIIDLEEVAEVTPPAVERLEGYPHTTFGPSSQDAYLGDLKDEFSFYEHDPERAEELLHELDFERNSDDAWVDDSGELIQLEAIDRGEEAGHLVNPIDRIEEFGFDVEILIMDEATYIDRRIDGDFHFFVGGSSVGNVYLEAVQTWATYDDVFPWFLPDNEVEIPMPIGDQDGDLEVIDTVEVRDSLMVAQNEEEVREYASQLMWMGNQHLGFYTVGWEPNLQGYRGDSWNFDVGPAQEYPGLKDTRNPLDSAPVMDFIEYIGD